MKLLIALLLTMPAFGSRPQVASAPPVITCEGELGNLYLQARTLSEKVFSLQAEIKRLREKCGAACEESK